MTAGFSRLQIVSTLQDDIRVAQTSDVWVQSMIQRVYQGTAPNFEIRDEILRFRDRICVPKDTDLRQRILSEAHSTAYSAYPGSTKMYQDLKRGFWWSGMKKDILDFVTRCLIVSRSK